MADGTYKRSLIDPDGTAGVNCDYVSLDLWEEDGGADGAYFGTGGCTSRNLDANNECAVAECKTSSGSADTSLTDIGTDWITSADDYILIRAHTGYRHAGVWDESKFWLHNNDAATPAYIRANYVRLDGLQTKVTATTGDKHGIVFISQSAEGDIRVGNLISRGVCSGGGASHGLNFNDAQIVATVWNSLFYGFVSGVDAGFRGIGIDNCTSVAVYNSVVYGCYWGIARIAGTVTVKNSAVGNCTDDFYGTIGMDYIVSDDDHSGNCANYWSAPTAGAGDWSSDFATPGSDFTLLATASDLIGHGVDDPGGAIQDDTDITGTTSRTSPWDIGAFEYVAAGGLIPRREIGAGVGRGIWRCEEKP